MMALKGNHELALRYVSHFREAEPEITGGSPEILNIPRQAALQNLMLLGIPDRKTENYRYTNLQPAFSGAYSFVHSREHADIRLKDVFKCDIPQLETHLIYLLNGWFHSSNGKVKNLPPGVIAESLEGAAATRYDLVAPRYSMLSEADPDPLVSLNTAYARDGYFLYVPRNGKRDNPVQVINFLQAEKDTFINQRNLIVVEPGAEAKIIVCDHTLNLNSYLDNQVTEVFIGENASLDFYFVQNRHNKAVTLHSAFFHLESDARLTTHSITLHGRLVRNNLKVLLDGQNSEANLFGLSFMDRKQHVDHFLQVIHEKPGCRSNQHYKNVLDDESTGAFAGRIHVRRNAQKTNAYQRNNNLLLTDRARMQTKPQLIIEADDVKCSHGATVGQIDDSALFYLRSRGIEEEQARLMLMNAFAYEVVRQIRVDPLRDRISELIDKRLRGEVSRCHECDYHCEC
jgi:Fe-S cluster assembly protein SufD